MEANLHRCGLNSTVGATEWVNSPTDSRLEPSQAAVTLVIITLFLIGGRLGLFGIAMPFGHDVHRVYAD